MKDGTFSDDATKEDRSVLRKMALKYVLVDGELYWKAWNGMLLRCVGMKEGEEIMKKIYDGVFGTHLSGISLARKIMRWIEAQSYKILTAKQVARFIEQNIFCRYSVSYHIVTDNGSHFQAVVSQLLYRYKVEHHHSSPYQPQANDAVEVANKEIKRILSKMCEKYRSWKSYGKKKSLRVLVEAALIKEEWVQEKDQMRKRRIARFYNQREHPRALKNGDLVLVRLLDHESQSHPGGKFRPNWHGPFRIQKLLAKGVAELVTIEGKPFNRIVNQD
ncbi:uncharacterized protein LOC119369888 [Jatropha curcas]|uniref:uncharacterized protein LOC119369888 n=1 Tax=Jatropha curcas TaxID=180498 RepID=UPI0018954805|nr:uncharacterized protein LOC119369888 [Jatropha curcas]